MTRVLRRSEGRGPRTGRGVGGRGASAKALVSAEAPWGVWVGPGGWGPGPVGGPATEGTADRRELGRLAASGRDVRGRGAAQGVEPADDCPLLPYTGGQRSPGGPAPAPRGSPPGAPAPGTCGWAPLPPLQPRRPFRGPLSTAGPALVSEDTLWPRGAAVGKFWVLILLGTPGAAPPPGSPALRPECRRPVEWHRVGDGAPRGAGAQPACAPGISRDRGAGVPTQAGG